MPASLWPAPVADGPVRSVVRLPGSKSMTNRALVLASLATGPTTLRRPLRSRDTLLMAAALRALGVSVTDQGGEDDRPQPADHPDHAGPNGPNGGAAGTGHAGPDWLVRPAPFTGPARVDVGLAGNVMRFTPAIAALAVGEIAFDGDPRARDRPMGPLISALRALGVEIDDGGRGALPFTVQGRGTVPGGSVTIDASGSSQLVSGLLLAAPRFEKGVEVRHEGPPVPSAPHLAMTVHMLRAAGATVEVDENLWRVLPGPIDIGELSIEPDLSNAAQFLGAALVTGGQVTVSGWPADTTQPGDALRGLLAEMGGAVSYGPDGLTVRGPAPGGERPGGGPSGGHGGFRGIEADLRDVGELTPVLAALAALAGSPSRLTGIAHLRGHETDRLAALVTELNALGGDARELPDGLEIRPRPLHGGVFRTYDDHRMVMAAALLGLVVPGIEIENVATVGKTLPEFTRLWTQMVAPRVGS